jgi:HNH endonuclease
MGLLGDLIARDDPACVWCGRELWRSDLTAEHLLPRSRGGHGTLENLTVACRRCNRARGTRSVTAYVRARRQAGAAPRIDTLLGALARLAASPRRPHAAYGARQLALLRDLAADDQSSAA